MDLAISGYVGMLAWPRFQKVLAAAIVDADPEAAAARTVRARTERGVWATDAEDGLKTVIARAAAGDVVWFMAAVNRIADILTVNGDTDPVGARRSKAIGILAQPGVALQLLIDHQHDTDDPTQPAEPHRHGLEEPDDQGAAPADEVVDDHVSLDLAATNLTSRVGCGTVSRPRVTLVFHLSDAAVRDGHGTVRPEHGTPETLAQLHRFLADTGCQVTVRPVLDPAATAPVDGYEIPHRIRAAVRLRHPGETFPYGSSTSAHHDLDHTIPYRAISRGGPLGQTGVDTLGPLSRSAHRATTLGRWRRRQPDPGTFVWKSPNGWIHLLTNHGTLTLGTTPFAQAIWHAATTLGREQTAPRTYERRQAS